MYHHGRAFFLTQIAKFKSLYQLFTTKKKHKISISHINFSLDVFDSIHCSLKCLWIINIANQLGLHCYRQLLLESCTGGRWGGGVRGKKVSKKRNTLSLRVCKAYSKIERGAARRRLWTVECNMGDDDGIRFNLWGSVEGKENRVLIWNNRKGGNIL